MDSASPNRKTVTDGRTSLSNDDRAAFPPFPPPGMSPSDMIA
jgi:hypothetical protein